METSFDCSLPHSKEMHLNRWQNVGQEREGAFQEKLGVSEVKEPTIIPDQKGHYINFNYAVEPYNGGNGCHCLSLLAMTSLVTPCVFLLASSSAFFAQGVEVSSTSTEYLSKYKYTYKYTYKHKHRGLRSQAPALSAYAAPQFVQGCMTR